MKIQTFRIFPKKEEKHNNFHEAQAKTALTRNLIKNFSNAEKQQILENEI